MLPSIIGANNLGVKILFLPIGLDKSRKIIYSIDTSLYFKGGFL